MQATTERLNRYEDAWARKMIDIWRDRMALLDVYRTGALFRSPHAAAIARSGLDAQMAFDFIRYGIYVDAGTGRGYTRGDDGKMQMRDKAYRLARGLGKQRQKRRWFSVSWHISVSVLRDHVALILGDATRAAVIDELK